MDLELDMELDMSFDGFLFSKSYKVSAEKVKSYLSWQERVMPSL